MPWHGHLRPESRRALAGDAGGARRLVSKQAALLDAAADAVAPGGLLMYSTCSLEREENEAQVDRWLADHPGFVREPSDTFPETLLSPTGDLMIVPQVHRMDGAYAARLRRVQ
jgi:16S rRNA (cytosine967-C5)-methyltransferase